MSDARPFEIRLPRKPWLGVFFLTLALSLAATCASVASNPDSALYVVASAIAATICFGVGRHMAFTSHRLVVTGTELRLELMPRREVLVTMPRESIRRLAVRKVGHGGAGLLGRWELVASDVNGDNRLFLTADERLARAIQRRVESELADPGAQPGEAANESPGA